MRKFIAAIIVAVAVGLSYTPVPIAAADELPPCQIAQPGQPCTPVPPITHDECIAQNDARRATINRLGSELYVMELRALGAEYARDDLRVELDAANAKISRQADRIARLKFKLSGR